ncbi:MAG: tetratricopeptide repeat protein [Candidatus Omnitrophota bacterium]|jgi:tetratricopeptide (TPR) repeat protein
MRGVVLLILCLLAPGAFAAVSEEGSPGPAPSQPTYYDEALRLRDAGRYSEAESELKRAIEFEPSNADYHFELANLYALHYDTLSKKAKENSGGRLLEQAAESLDQAVMIRSDFIAARFNLGVIYKRRRLFEKAREAFKEVLRQDPRQVSALLQIGATYEEQGFYDDAKAAYDQAREIDATHPGIQAAMEGLEAQKREQSGAQGRSLNDAFSSLSRAGGQFPYGAGSHAAEYENDRTGANGSGQSMTSALPYLGSWLYQQFMKSKNDEE